SLVPRQEECQNLLVSVCVSSTHIAYGSIRMEPVFMIRGPSAGTAAALAIRAGPPVPQADYTALCDRLKRDGQILEWSHPTTSDLPSSALPSSVSEAEPARIGTDGIVTHSIRSEFQDGIHELAVLTPAVLEPGRRYPVLFVLP